MVVVLDFFRSRSNKASHCLPDLVFRVIAILSLVLSFLSLCLPPVPLHPPLELPRLPPSQSLEPIYQLLASPIPTMPLLSASFFSVSGGPFGTDYAEDGAGRSGAVASTALRPGTADQIIISAALHPSSVAFLLSSVALRRSTASAAATLLRRLVDAA